MAGRSMGVIGPMAASMKKARLEGPVFGEVRLVLVFVVPAAVPQLKNPRSRKGLLGGKVLVRSHP